MCSNARTHRWWPRFAITGAALALAALHSAVPAAALAQERHGEHATWGSAPIPEPMVFDLVRPLGARRGELEVNSLFLRPVRRAEATEWAPEMECVFAPGHAVELELPFAGRVHERWKLAMQGTLPSPRGSARFQHGWQMIGEWGRHDRSRHRDLLYVAGGHLTSRTSVLAMSGRRAIASDTGRRGTALHNATLFVTLRPTVTAGLETNLERERGAGRRTLVMPQAQVELSSHYALSVGGGWERAPAVGRRPVASARVVRMMH